jgi:ribosomal protein S18 acetylase RimI-like enzyme
VSWTIRLRRGNSRFEAGCGRLPDAHETPAADDHRSRWTIVSGLPQSATEASVRPAPGDALGARPLRALRLIRRHARSSRQTRVRVRRRQHPARRGRRGVGAQRRATAVPLGVALLLCSLTAAKRAGYFVVATIFIGGCVAAIEAFNRLLLAHSIDHLVRLALVGAIASSATRSTPRFAYVAGATSPAVPTPRACSPPSTTMGSSAARRCSSRAARGGDIPGADEGEFRMLAVDPAARGRGVGEQLVRGTIEVVRSAGGARVVIRAPLV